MANPQDNAPPGFTSDWVPDASLDAGPFYPLPGVPPISSPTPFPLGRTVPIIAVSGGFVTVTLDSLQFGISTTQFPISSLPVGFAPTVGMYLQFTTDGQVYLLAPSDEDEAPYPHEPIEETYPDYGDPTHPGSTLQAVKYPEPARAVSHSERLYQSRREVDLLPWWHDLIPR